MFDSISTLAVASNMRELYRLVLVDTPLAPYFSESLTAGGVLIKVLGCNAGVFCGKVMCAVTACKTCSKTWQVLSLIAVICSNGLGSIICTSLLHAQKGHLCLLCSLGCRTQL